MTTPVYTENWMQLQPHRNTLLSEQARIRHRKAQDAEFFGSSFADERWYAWQRRVQVRFNYACGWRRG